MRTGRVNSPPPYRMEDSMAQPTAPLQERANVTSAQVGNGKTPHYMAASSVQTDTLCSRRISRALTDAEAAKMGDHCKRCVKVAEQRAADNAPAAGETPAAAPESAPATVKPLAEDFTAPATMFDPELTYYADGTAVVMRWEGGEKAGTTIGMTVDRSPYQYQAVRFEDGTTSNVAPHVLHRRVEGDRYFADYETIQGTDRITVTRDGSAEPVFTAELPYDPQRNAGEALAALGWTIAGMDSYAGPALFRAIVRPATPAEAPAAPQLMPDHARGIVTTTWPDAHDFQSCHDENGQFLGYTFQATRTTSSRYGWITSTGTYAKSLEPYRSGAEAMLPMAVLDDERRAQRPDPAAQRAAALAAHKTKAAQDTARHRAETDNRIAAQARRYGSFLPQPTADRIAERNQPGPFKPGDLIVCADGITRTVQAMAATVAGEPAHVIVDGGAQWIAHNCHHAEELTFHGPQGYTGPRALCGYADHTAPADQSGNLAVHERNPGTMGPCPGSLKSPRAHREELTRRHTTAYSYAPPRPTFLACTAQTGDVVVWDEQERTVHDCHPSDTRHVLVTFTDDTAAPFTLDDRLTYRRRIRRHDVRCHACGVTAVETADEAVDGTPTHRLCGVCDHPDATDPEHRTAVLEEAAARLTARAVYSTAHAFQSVAAPENRARRIGWTFRTGYGAQARYGWVTCLGRLIPQVGTEHRWQADRAVEAHHEAGTLAPTGHDPVALLAARPLAEVRLGLEALRGDEAPAEAAPARPALEGVIVQHDGTTKGCAPRHVDHPDVAAARKALDGLKHAALTDRHDISEPTEEEQDVRGYVIDPRGHGRVALYWLEGGRIVRHDDPAYGAALDCLEDRMRRRGWSTEKMLRSSHCLFAHVPQDQRQG
ncbi:hypothetical protein [Streptomyces halobius]|uniref:Uncharacterized protein n=1 Tax=Streptomyces halobius TaxID=2879846 RepID=A0ABY4MH59_9ACTN|nr:hypothetical protein [Streptomyces halobius]UQA95656.1 hypothetical protein K9S39_30710 [Streptomyces halobius]